MNWCCVSITVSWQRVRGIAPSTPTPYSGLASEKSNTSLPNRGQWGLHRGTSWRSLGMVWNTVDPSWGFLPRNRFSAVLEGRSFWHSLS